MLFRYVPEYGVFRVPDDFEDTYLNCSEVPDVNRELGFTFPSLLHPLNIELSQFFGNKSGLFHYDSSVMYVKEPYFYVISPDRYPALHNLVLRVEAFESFSNLSLDSLSDDSENE